MSTHTAETIVVGGGVMGLASARELARRGHSVTLLERSQPGRAASWASAGIIGATSRSESDPAAGLRRLSSALWPSFAEAVQAESGLDPEYRQTGCLHLATNAAELETLHLAAERQAAEPNHPELLDDAQVRVLEPTIGPRVVGALRAPGGNVDNRRLCRALEIAALRAGVRIETGVEVRALTTASGRVTGVEAAERHVAGDLVVIAAGAWSASIRDVRPRPPVTPQRGQLFALDQLKVGIRHVLLTPGDPYFVPRCDGRLVVGATREAAGWDPSLTAGGVAWLLNRAIHVVPALEHCPIVELWTGFRPSSADGLPLIGRGEFDGLFFLTGHGPSGIAPLPGSVALLLAAIADEDPPVPAASFDPLRFARSP